MRRTLGLLTMVVGLALSSSPALAARLVVADGHVDIGPRILEGEWTIQVRDDSVHPPVWRDLGDVVLQAVDAARQEVPPGGQFDFLGAPGDRVWLLPQVQREGILWPGWNTQAPEVARRVEREIDWTLHGVRGPGRFVLFSNEEFGEPRVLFDSTRPVPQEIGIDVDTHVHGNWAFSKRGVYLLDIEMSAALRDGERVSGRGTLRFYAGAGDAKAAFAAEAQAGGAGTTTSVWLAAAIGPALLAGAVVLWRRRTRRAEIR